MSEAPWVVRSAGGLGHRGWWEQRCVGTGVVLGHRVVWVTLGGLEVTLVVWRSGWSGGHLRCWGTGVLVLKDVAAKAAKAGKPQLGGAGGFAPPEQGGKLRAPGELAPGWWSPWVV